ncbi:hypothetical protein CJU89_4853 [Yarrowia sp. B02]|nr:hypothetical protein CJU89_4853 [Yarrowia sp. B02]
MHFASKETKIFDATWFLPTPANVGKNGYDNYMKRRVPRALYVDIDAGVSQHHGNEAKIRNDFTFFDARPIDRFTGKDTEPRTELSSGLVC